MKLFVAFAALVLAVSAASDSELWTEFKKNHNKTYKNMVEERLRFAIFQKNLRKIEAHNIKFETGEKSYQMGVNKFADWTSEEFVKYNNFQIPKVRYSKTFKVDPNFVAPSSIDWRDKDAVLEVKDQGNCGSCWAFSATGSLEGQNAIKHKKKISLSEQELVDCTVAYGNAGCDGGAMEAGFEYIIDNGINTEKDYPYTARDGRCKPSSTKADISISGYTDLDATEDALFDAVASVGPVSIAINADLLQLYTSGVFDEPSCSDAVNHGVLVVGYGSEGKDFWIVKNSWGKSWGENGYFRIVRNKNQQCAIGSWNTYPDVN